jgi:hypothetical protein
LPVTVVQARELFFVSLTGVVREKPALHWCEVEEF